ncbi:hypothetical protein ACHWQZ_G005804 [Mnemiopsis leidyi]
MSILSLFLIVICLTQVEGEEEVGLQSRRPDSLGGVVETCNTLKEEAQQIRREGYSAIDKADGIREQAYRVKDQAYELKEEAYEIKESALEARSALEGTLVETLALMKSQATTTNLYIQEIRASLSSLSERLESLEQDVGEKFAAQSDAMEEKFAAQSSALDKLEEKVVSGTTEVVAKVTETQTTVATIKNRQQSWMSEIRLISLYKLTEENNRNPSGYDSDLITDGQFVDSLHREGSMRTYSHTLSRAHNNKIWIALGGLFRIHKIKIWNVRQCCQDQLVGSHIYADDKLIGTVIEPVANYDFTVADNDPTYASKVTLHQPLAKHIHILEMQVWGSGPFQNEDKFA